MSTGVKWMTCGATFLLGAAILCSGGRACAKDASGGTQNQKTHKKSKKQETPPPPLPSGPTGPVQQIPLDSIAAVPPQVIYENNQLTINAPNSTLGDILRAVRKSTGAEIEIPSAPERVVTHLGPGPARDVVAELLNGSRFNYVLLGSPDNAAALTRVVLVAKTTSPDLPNAPTPMGQQAIGQPQQPDAMQEAEAESSDDNSADDNSDQTPAEDQQPQEQNGIKTPQQMLQEMQQRQMQMQQQQQQGQQQGQPPMPPGRPPGPPQQNQQDQ